MLLPSTMQSFVFWNYTQMAMIPASMTSMLLIAVAATLFTMNFTDGAVIDIVNRCRDTITACACSGSETAYCYVLNGSVGTTQIDVKSSWLSGAVWAFPSDSGDPDIGVLARVQANIAEFTVGGSNNRDYYDISNVNAYNLGMSINVTSIAPGDSPSPQHCEPIFCSIANLTTFCQSPNTLTGPPGDGCSNIDGPYETQPTSATTPFNNACPSAYSYAGDDSSSRFTCKTGSNYKVTFCPSPGRAAMARQMIFPVSY